MPVKVENIQRHSIAEGLPIKKGCIILSIDDEPVHDILDVLFLSQKDIFEIKYQDSRGQHLSCHVKNRFDKPLGFEVMLPECESCINQCIFCFVDQMPPGLRRSLYVKDDDFIYSFFYGNFITLTNLSQKSINKIIRQHISPLYISVHTTDSALHKYMLGYEVDFDILHALKILDEAKIDLHIQIVLIPEINDKDVLLKSLSDLLSFENILSIGIVPVGLTKYRDHLTALRKPSQAEAISLISAVEKVKDTEKKEHIYCADELYILAEMPIPADSYYGDYEQIENGIGMVRKSLENWKYLKKKFIKYLKNIDGNPVFVTSVSGFFAVKKIVKDIQKSFDKSLALDSIECPIAIRTAVIKNHFFGAEVTVTGLLTWQDIKSQLIFADTEYPIFSSGIFNIDMHSIDGQHISDIKKEINKKIIVVDELFTQWEEY